MAENCYIHIPFCKSKCKYCSFVSYPCIEKLTAYIYSLLKEISSNYAGEQLKTLYIGGGTPSLVSIDLLAKILKKFNYSQDCEITIEINPDDVTDEIISNYLHLGINRFSVGVQTFDDKILSIIGRRHNKIKTMQALDTIFNSGIKNISLDFIYGLPEQTLKSFLGDLKCAFSMPVVHISLYGLKIERGTEFWHHMPENLPDDDFQSDMYEAAIELLKNHGFMQYEISNFSHPSFQSRHNLNYWNNNSYYGFGVSAHGYINGFRYYNTSGLEEYINKPDISEYAHYVTEKEHLEEEIFLGLRKKEGLDITNMNTKFGINFEKKYSDIIKKYSGEFLVFDNDRIRLTTKGFMLSNIILSEFI